MTKQDGGMTHKDLSRLLGVSETTVKSYRRKFPECIPVANQGKPIRFRSEAAAVCTRIRDLFELGMSVPEVRTRLAEEFAWIEPEAPAAAPPAVAEELPAGGEKPAEPVAVAPAQPARVELSQDFTTAVSGLARSMVHLTQQQTAMMKRLQGLEQHLEGVVASVAASAGPAGQAAGAHAVEETQQLAARLLAAVERFEALVERLGTEPVKEHKSEFRVVPLLKALGRRRGDADREAQPEAGPEPVSASGAQPPEKTAEQVAEQATGNAGPVVASSPAEGAQPAVDTFEASGAYVHQEPARSLMTLPLVVQTTQGEFVGVAGRARGRFSCADFKAMLSYAFLPPDQYELRWEDLGDGWRLELAQPTATDPLHMVLTLRRMVTPRGNDVLCLQHFESNGTPGQPWDIHGFIRAALG